MIFPSFGIVGKLSRHLMTLWNSRFGHSEGRLEINFAEVAHGLAPELLKAIGETLG